MSKAEGLRWPVKECLLEKEDHVASIILGAGGGEGDLLLTDGLEQLGHTCV